MCSRRLAVRMPAKTGVTSQYHCCKVFAGNFMCFVVDGCVKDLKAVGLANLAMTNTAVRASMD